VQRSVSLALFSKTPSHEHLALPDSKNPSKGKPPQRAQRGVLPEGMSAKSLRRTFGSLLLRSGKSSAEVAAAMGNTEQVVRDHYARLLGREVKVDY